MTSYYFAYGSNLNQQDWNNWCALRGFSPHLLRPITNVYVPDYELHFSHHSNSRGGGALNIVESLGNAVEGILFEVLDEEGWQALNEKEGAPYVYEKVDMVAYDDLGNEFSVATYVLKEERFHDYVKPAPGYVDIVAAGLEEFGLCTRALQAAAANQPIPLITDAIFSYGTLMRGECRFQHLADFGVVCNLLASAPGRLVDLGSFPGLLPPVEKDTWVQGDFVRLERFQEAIPLLDQIEGFEGYGKDGSLYSRRLTWVEVGDGRFRRAWVYIYQDFDGEAIESGCWRQHHNKLDRIRKEIVKAHFKNSKQNIARRLRDILRFQAETPRTFREVWQALSDETLSERKLAQASSCWTAFC